MGILLYAREAEKTTSRAYQVTEVLPPWFLRVLDVKDVSCD
jgi:hypothetical protein